jgi:AhpD family alkylhydroperoxidase
MTLRIDYAKVAPDVYKALISTHTALKRSGFDTHLMDLVFQRVSQINGCAYCVDAHGRDLRAAGETPERLDGLNRLFSNRSDVLRLMRDIGLGVVERLPVVKDFFIREAAGLTGEVPKLLKGEAL